MTTYTSIATVVKERRSIRTFINKVVEKELLIELLNDATWAPNHKHREPWQCKLFMGDGRKTFVNAVLSSFSAEEREKRGKMLTERFMNTPAQIVVYMDEDPRQVQRDEDYAAVCAFIQNFQLLAWEHQLGTVWKTGGLIYNPDFMKAIGLTKGHRIVGVLHVGYFDKVPEGKERTPIMEKLEIIEG
ncbi:MULTISPECIES: nitroreductase [unclassified Bacillus (in: firmicutes)]|uniref:nitroreductase family protein n=1 Tax=unclassified Bacillus (in: firmicutes) TaxID=185979 RepID=UPI0008EFA172|nr:MULTISPECIES: nitroreductase [unclassified Bacillus (in: firmicutes)]SFJ94883.1 Nitroreductase [Bacillus sp. 71mf]SFS99434.1 Nitroreductase [Bacillus sp. 103mf]